MLLKGRANINSRDIYLNIPLYQAITYESIAKLLLINRANINVKNNY